MAKDGQRRGANGQYTTAKLTAPQAASIKLKVADGESIAEAARVAGLTYMAVYKLAIGETWKGIEPSGCVIQRRGSIQIITPELRDQMYELKRRERLSNAKLARMFSIGETTAKRAVAAARALLAARVHQLLLTSGDHRTAIERYGVTVDEADDLVSFATSNKLTKRQLRELAHDS
jgi:hypothetical protein